MQYHAIPCNTMQYNAMTCYTMQYHVIPCNTMQYHAIPCNTMQYHAIPWNINNCWRSVPLPCGQYNGHFYLFLSCQSSSIPTYEAVSDQGPVWVQREPIFRDSWKVLFNDEICSKYYNVMYWERILQKNHLITCFRRFYQHPNHLAAYIPILGRVDVGTFIKVANIHSGFGVLR